ncbi:uncharacterized protein LOC132195218 [Neocloeon triangulifer]|uniref:uncharacterized protein LOC132195218 n=1 Tax=Neocloeon triangulifer TaxID=2078957 RepID=UPI00286F0938|nr:uncharacterized protein LOC132195218 [Neocloeon triangulifer]
MEGLINVKPEPDEDEDEVEWKVYEKLVKMGLFESNAFSDEKSYGESGTSSRKQNFDDSSDLDEEDLKKNVSKLLASDVKLEQDEDLFSDVEEDQSSETEAKPLKKGRRGRKRKHSDSSKQAPLFDLGELVFAQVRGYNPWPARIDDIIEHASGNTDLCKYQVFFFGTHQKGTCGPKFIKPFGPHKEEMLNKYSRKLYHQACVELQFNPQATAPPPAPPKAKVENKKPADKKILTAKRRKLTLRSSKLPFLTRSLFNNRSFYFGKFNDAGVNKCDKPTTWKPIWCERKPIGENDEEALKEVTESEFGQTLGRVASAVALLKTMADKMLHKVF